MILNSIILTHAHLQNMNVFDGTILEKQYYLKNPLVSEMYYNSPWSQPERGLYIETRYKFLRQLTLTKVYLDMWERKSDGRKSVRFQGELEYRPIYQIAMRLKQKLQTNGSEDFLHTSSLQNK